uniref:Transposase domain-containing protein n=1 Tax=Anopheles dirus TaxID=7168 RepID=A0A182N4L1_9DIPT
KHNNLPTTLEFDINIDGLPLHKKPKTQFWPILLKVVGYPQWPVLIVAIFCGPSKPESNETFLRSLVDEINSLSNTGLVLDGGKIDVKLRAIIADIPARSFAKGVQGHTGRNSCLKCCCKGETLDRRVVFVDTNAPRRTDEAFRNGEYGLHQTGTTPLIDLPNFDIIEGIISCERLHQIDIGVTKKMLKIFYDGVLPGRRRWNRQQRDIIDRRLNSIIFPMEAYRKLPVLEELSSWKGSECKTFLHYAAPVVLKGILSDEEYKHFMLYFCAITIFSSTAHKTHWIDAKKMLTEFVEQCKNIYGKISLTPNVHSLLHIYDEAMKFGALQNYSTYCFESKLGQIKNRLIRTSYRCLEQAIRRISELESFNLPSTGSTFKKPVYKKRGQTIRLYLREGFTLKNDGVNEWFLTSKNEVCRFISAYKTEGKLIISYRMFSTLYEYFTEHISSLELFIYSAERNEFFPEIFETDCADVKCKLVSIYDEKESK